MTLYKKRQQCILLILHFVFNFALMQTEKADKFSQM